jgi:hypothetical protein
LKKAREYLGVTIRMRMNDLMTIEITKPEIEVLIQQRLRSGAFESVEEILLDALETQGERESWLREDRGAIDEKIGRGLAQLDRGEGIDAAELGPRLEAARVIWLADHDRR